jgi:hypothetical protein
LGNMSCRGRWSWSRRVYLAMRTVLWTKEETKSSQK